MKKRLNLRKRQYLDRCMVDSFDFIEVEYEFVAGPPGLCKWFLRRVAASTVSVCVLFCNSHASYSIVMQVKE